MPPPPHAKPENVLKRAQELVAVGKDQAALELLHDQVASKRSRNAPIASLEPVMILLVELCVKLRKGKPAKEGLYQYKNIAQNTSVQTIEIVLKKFIELAEQKVTEAQEKAEQITLETVDDLEASETPESILLSTVSGEQSKDRTDRVVVTPWLKFLWETYRTVLDILRNNARLEVMYQSTALQAFQFCLKYARKTEFRRLCELLRTHVQNATKYSTQMHAINLNDPDTLQRHLDTRFQQLNVAVELELWQEAFRSVEDIHTLLNLSKRPPKAIMMANYYEKLTRIFLVSENYLFHAAAWNRYYNLLRQSAAAVAAGVSLKRDAPATNEADVTRAASFVLLSALAIPVISTSRSRGALLDVDETKKNKNTRLTNLLGMGKAPTRGGLFKDALSKGLLKRARPEIRELYAILEVDFHPLSICKKISPILTQIAEDPEMKRYIQPLHQVILTRLFQQLSQVYETVQLDFVISLATFPAPFEVSPSTIEKFIMNGCKKGDLPIRIDHAAGVLTFESDVFSSTKSLHAGSGAGSAEKEASVQKLQSTPSEIVRSQLSRLAKALYLTCTHVDPSFNAERENAKAAALERASAGAEKEHKETLARRSIIEKKKEAAENALLKKEKEEAHIRLLRQQELTEAENRRLKEQAAQREAARIKAEQDRIREAELLKQLEELKSTGKLDVDVTDLQDMDSNRLREMKLQQLDKEKREMTEKLRIVGKRIDHLERAFRREEVKVLHKDYDAQKENDLASYNDRIKALNEAAERKHTEDVALKQRLSRLVGSYEQFRDEVRERRHEEFEARRKSAEKQLKQEMEKRRKQVREEQERKRKAEEEAERQRREEEERMAQEEEARIRKEEDDRERMRKEKEEREEQRRKLDETAAKQRQREQEAEERRAREKAEKFASVRAPVAPVSASAEPEAAPAQRWRPAEKPPGTSWREREAAKKAAAANGESTQSPPSATPPSAAPPSAAPPSERPRLNLAKPSVDRERERVPERAPERERVPERAPERAPERPERTEREIPIRTSTPGDAEAPKAKYVPPSLRRRQEEDSSSAPPPPAPPAAEGETTGKYRPGAFSSRRGGGGAGMGQARRD